MEHKKEQIKDQLKHAEELLEYHRGLTFYGADLVIHAKHNRRLEKQIRNLKKQLKGKAE